MQGSTTRRAENVVRCQFSSHISTLGPKTGGFGVKKLPQAARAYNTSQRNVEDHAVEGAWTQQRARKRETRGE